MNRKIAIVGMSGRFPDAATTGDFYENLCAARSSIRGISASRIKDTTLPAHREYQLRGFMEDIHYFDHKLFNIPKGEAVNMDPHQRMLLEVVFEAIENAGYNPDELRGSNTAVFVADKNLQYFEHADEFDPTLVTGNASEFMAAHINRSFHFTGSTALIDTSCSSSLVALHNACNELSLGDADMAVVCGANLELFPYKNIGYHIEVDSADGKSIPFSDQSNGMVYGEAVIAFLLKPFDKAMHDGDHIHAVITASAVNNNAARSASLTAPDSYGQAEVILRTWEKARIDPSHIGFIEAHGSGTQLGDKLEVAGLNIAFGQFGLSKQVCPVSTVKANIGHCRSVAGLAGLVKAVLSIKNGVIFPSVYTGTSSPLINFADSAVYISEHLSEWKKADNRKRIAGVSSIGFSGTNCHLILEEAPRKNDIAGTSSVTQVPILLSSWFEEGVVTYAQRLLQWLDKNETVTINDIAFTLNLGRRHYQHRKAFMVDDVKTLKEGLANYIVSSQKNTRKQPGKNNKLVFIFSDGDRIPKELTGRLCTLYPIFSECFTLYTQQLEACTAQRNEFTDAFIFQLSLYRLFERAGIVSNQLIGTGIGRIITRTINQSQSFEESIRILLEYKKEAIADPSEKMKQYIVAESVNGRLLFIDMSIGSILSDVLQHNEQKNRAFDIYTGDETGENCLMASLGIFLYQNGYSVPVIFLSLWQGQRIELPPHPFARIACWIRTEARKEQEVSAAGSTNRAVVEEDTHSFRYLVKGYWKEALQLAAVQDGDHFFETGGDSLKASAVVRNIRKSLQIEIDFEDIFDYPVFSDFYNYIYNKLSLEKRLQYIWKEVLKADEIKPEDNFFELGGHSLLANQVLNRISQRLGIKVDFEDFFLYPTIHEFSTYLDKKNKGETGQVFTKAVMPVAPAVHYALSHSQRRVWMVSQMEKESIAYNEFNIVKLDGPVNKEALSNALDTLIHRHESFRTCFPQLAEGPVQMILPASAHPGLQYIDISDIADAHAETLRLASGLHLDPFDLEKGPLLRCLLVKLKEGSFVFMMAIHHIIFDEWSFQVFQKELSLLYNANCNATPLHLPDLSIQYKDYAAWINEEVEAKAENKPGNYWLERFKGEVPELELPYDFPRPAIKTYNGKLLQLLIPEDTRNFMISVAKKQGASSFMLMLATVNLLLHKYSGQQEIILGTAVTGREREELENQVGFYVNTLALKTGINKESSFLHLLKEVRQTVIDAYQHQLYPFDLLVENLHIPANRSRLPLFDVMVLYRKVNSEIERAIGMQGITASSFADTTTVSKFDIGFEFIEQEDNFFLNITYNTDLFLQSSIERLGEHYLELLANLEKNIDSPLLHIHLVSPKKSEWLSDTLGNGGEPVDPPGHLSIMFEEQVAANPGAVALKTTDGMLTYGELSQKVNQLAAYLQSNCGLQAGEAVGIIGSHTFEMIIAVFSVLKAGCIYVPLSASQPEGIIVETLQNAGVHIILAGDKGLIKLLTDKNYKTVDYNNFDGSNILPVLVQYNPGALACILHTSGSTGVPKGARLTHEGLSNIIKFAGRRFGINTGSVILQRLQYIFDFSLLEIFGALCNGACLFIITPSQGDLEGLNQLMDEQKITGVCFTPAELKSLLNYEEKKNKLLAPSLQWVISGGEELRTALTQQYYRLTTVPLINIYGPTEASVFVSYYEVKATDKKITIGKPVPGILLNILDGDMNPVPVGVKGKLYLEGIGLAKDYIPLSNPGNERFESFMHPRKGPCRRYDTGDICRWLDDGNIEFIGRADNQIKCKGFRIEPEEIENALLLHPAINDAVLVYKKHDAVEGELIAYVIAAAGNREEPVSLIDNTVAEIKNKPASAEELALLAAWNDTDKMYPESLIDEWLEKWAAEIPGKTAVSCGERVISYSILNTKVNVLAGYLLQKGAVKGTVIPVFCKRSPELLIAFLAILKIGAVYLPVATDSPAERVLTILNDCEADYLLIENIIAANELLNLEKIHESVAVSILEITEGVHAEPPEREMMPAPLGEDLAYIIYTSGSTGKPKGAMVEHKGMLNHLYYKIESLSLHNNSSIIQNAPQAFDISIWQLLSMIVTGGTTIIYPDEVVKDLNLFARTITADQPSILELVPSYLAALLDLPETAISSWKIEQLVVTGETLKPQLTRKWFERFSTIPMVNAYGPTEAADDIAQFTLTGYDSSLETIPIGKPIANMKIYILDGAMNHCAIGVKGDIYTSGIGVGRGYINNIEKTEEHFFPDPWHKNRRMYKLGDTGRYKADGNIEFFGRKDNQVKINGNRIELGEIEQSFLRQKEITDAVVVCLKDQQDLPVLVAYITGTPVPAIPVIRDAVAQLLPFYMLPSHIVALDYFPLTPNGKTDRAALPYPPQLKKQNISETEMKMYLAAKVPEYMIPSRIIELKVFPQTASRKTDRKKMAELEVQKKRTHSYEAPVSAVEKKLCSIWGKILDKHPVGVLENFFDLGGNSLKGMRLISEIEREIGIRIPFWKIFVFVTVAQQAELFENETIQSEVTISRQPDKSFYPVSDAQKRLWVLSQLSDSGSAYHITGGIKFKGNLDVAAWQKAWNALFERHEILRTSFFVQEDEVVQRIHSEGELEIPFSIIDARSAADKIVSDTWDEHQHTIFDLEKGVLSKASLVQTGGDDYVFIYTVHHILVDEWSFEVLSRELLLFYSSLIGDNPLTLPKLPVQYRDFAVWQQEQAQSPATAAGREYWLNRLSGPLPVLELPNDFPRPPVKTYNGAYQNIEIDNILPALKKICHTQGTTIFMNLLAGINVLLHQYTGQKDIIIGYPVTGRDMDILSGQVGLYQNTLALRTRFSSRDSFSTVLDNVKKDVIGAFAHQNYPFNKLLQELEVKRNLSRSPLFDVMMVMHDGDMRLPADAMPGDLTVSEFHQPGGASKFDISFHFLEKGDTLRLTINYNTDLFSNDHIRYMLLHFQVLLKNIVANPASAVGEYDYMDAEENELLAGNFNSSLAPVQQVTLTGMLEQLAAAEPATIAVVCGEEKISRLELHQRSAQMANYLQHTYGAGKGNVVAVKMKPSISMVVAILGIIKTGAAYMPVDAVFPRAKTDYMMKDSEAALIISDESFGVEGTLLLWDASFDHQLNQEDVLFVSPAVISDTAYIIYTSGSTGQPKGVPVSHFSLVNYVHGFGTAHLQHKEYRGLLVSSVAFDLGYTCFWTMLLGYGTLYLWKDEGHWDPRSLFKLIDKEHISFIKLTPSHLKLLVQEFDHHSYTHAPSLMVTGGEKIQPDDIKKWLARYPFTRFVNHYGPTETTIGVLTQGIVASGAIGPDMTVNEFSQQVVLGRPLGNHHIYILDENRKLKGIGITGEICIGGPGVMTGYLRKEQLSAEKLIPDPYHAGQFIYRSGDKGRWTAGGRIEFFGRLDTQLKIAGYRVEAGEIEYAFRLLDGIHAAAVTIREESGQQQLIAFVVEMAPQNPKEIRKQLRQYLPDYMIPAFIISVSAIPLTPNGKVDYAQLPAVKGHTTTDGREPFTKEEKLLAEAYQSVLGVKAVGMEDDFFSRGGDSIKAIQIVSYLYRRNYKLMVKDIFNYPVLGDLAPLLGTIKQTVSQEAVEGYMALSPIQESFFERNMLVPQHYNQSVIVYSDERLEKILLAAVIEKIQQHHDALRIIFPEGEKRQQYNRDISFINPLLVKDLRNDSSSFEELLQQTERNFSLSNGPLFQATLYQLPDKDCLVLSVHHLLVDGISWRIIMEDLAELYKQAAQGQDFELSPKTDSYKTWVEELCNYVQSGTFNTDQAYWIQREYRATDALVTAPVENRKAGTAHLDFQLENDTTQSLLGNAHTAFNTEINDLLIAALSFAVGEVFDKKNVWIMMESHGREEIIPQVTINRTVGWFTSTYPVSMETGAGDHLSVHIKKVKHSLHEIPFRGIGYSLLKYKRKLEGTPCPDQLPQILFNYLGQFDNTNGSSQFRFAPAPADMHDSNEKINFGITISGIIAEGKLGIQIHYDRSLFSSNSMIDLKNKFRQALYDIIQVCINRTGTELTPTDMGYDGLSMQEFESIFD